MTDFPRSVSEGAQVMADSPAAYWHLDEASGNFLDSSGNGWTLTKGGTVTYGVAGQFGTAITFDGTSGEGAATSFTPSSNVSITMECWVNITSGSMKGGVMHIGNADGFSFGVGNEAGGGPNSYFDVAGRDFIALYDGVVWVLPTHSLANGWHLLGMVIDASGHAKLYDNGVLVFTYVGATVSSPTAQVSIGRDKRTDFPTNGFFGGTIDDAAVYSSALTATRMLAHYNNYLAATDVVSRTSVLKRAITDALTAAVDVLLRSFSYLRTVTDTLTAATDALLRSFGRKKSVADTLTAATDSVSRFLVGSRIFNATVTPTGALGKLIRKVIAGATLAPAAVLLQSDSFWTYVTARLVTFGRAFVPVTVSRNFNPHLVPRIFTLSTIKNPIVSTLDTVPDVLELSIGEQVPINIDCTNVLLSGEVIQTSPVPTAAVTSYTNGVVIAGAVSGSVTINGNLLQVVLVGSVLKKLQSYYLVVTFNTSASKKLTTRTRLNCIF